MFCALPQASLTAAVRNINVHNKHVAVELVGYLLEELRDASNFKALQADVASANIFIGSLIFIEELADKVGASACHQGFLKLTPAARPASTVLPTHVASGHTHSSSPRLVRDLAVMMESSAVSITSPRMCMVTHVLITG